MPASAALRQLCATINHGSCLAAASLSRQQAESQWLCSRTVPSPSGRPACETILLHREDFKIPENMARFAVKHGMAGFVKKMGAGVPGFVAARRQRVDMVGAPCQIGCWSR